MSNILIGDNTALLLSAKQLIDSIDPTFYSRRQIGDQKSGIGPHIRHAVDHYLCLIQGIESGFVDYDQRQRNERVEVDPEAASNCILQITRDLKKLDLPTDFGLSVRMDCGSNNSTDQELCRSTFGRELQFLLSHTVHHFAIIDIYCSMHGIEVPSGFGIAPSTLKFQSATN